MSVLLLVCGFGIGMSWNFVFPQHTVVQESMMYQLVQIPQIQDVLRSVGTTVLQQKTAHPHVQAVVLPHHTVLGSTLDRYWAELAQSAQPDVIVIVSPAHGEQGVSLLQTTSVSWETPFGVVPVDLVMKNFFTKNMLMTEEPASFDREHGIGIHMPYIAHYFPDLPIIPVIAKSGAGRTLAEEFVDVLAQAPKNVLLVVSTDFAHYLPRAESLIHDEETWQAMQNKDLEAIDRFGPEHVDSSFALATYVIWQDQAGCLSSERWHEYNPAGTSYFVLMCVDQPIVRLSAVGDVMLARGVARSLYRSTIPASVSLLRHVSGGSDVVFGNLESVISDHGVAMDKAYTFEAPLASVALLEKMGFTHLSVANNHSADFGEVAWLQSFEVLNDHQIQPVGGFRNESVVSVVQKQDHTLALLAFQQLTYPLDVSRVLQTIADASRDNDVVVVSMHWGEEYVTQPNEEIIALAHAMIEAGADVILGHHPHVLQPVELYKNKLIFYSLGNFIFDQTGEQQNQSEIATIDFFEDHIVYQLTSVHIDQFFPRHLRMNE